MLGFICLEFTNQIKFTLKNFREVDYPNLSIVLKVPEIIILVIIICGIISNSALGSDFEITPQMIISKSFPRDECKYYSNKYKMSIIWFEPIKIFIVGIVNTQSLLKQDQYNSVKAQWNVTMFTQRSLLWENIELYFGTLKFKKLRKDFGLHLW